MHMVIYALVEASTQNDALATGKTVFDRLVGADPHSSAVFDYYVSFDEENTTVAARLDGDLPAASPLTRTMDRTYSTKGGKRRKKSSSAISNG